ncbi:unnamed protein product [Linum tenue]|uniref:Peroxisomal and mitochondrial division factor 2-like n=1 Tax=Linum tenue TaxID=586396 RepID=A0AAV0R2J7_9ROSI|nr:unnamed protein product [Linum tenue]
MADTDTNGATTTEEDREVEIFSTPDHRGDGDAKLKQKIEALELQNGSLVQENDEFKDQVAKLQAEMESLKSEESEMMQRLEELESELEQSEETKNTLDSIAARAGDLEIEVSRLQHDLITSMGQGEDYATEVAELKKVLGDMEVKLDEAKKQKAENEKRVRELERKVGVLEVKETEEKSKKIRLEEETRDRLAEKEKELVKYKKRVEELENELAKKAELEEKLRVSESRTREVEMRMVELQKEAEEAEKVIVALKQKAVETVNGFETDGREDKEEFVEWPATAVVIGSTGAIVVAAAAVAYFIYARRH